VAAALACCAALLTPSAAHADTGSQILERARSWTEAGVGYQAGGTFTNQYGTYRTDCSGYVSMALGLPTSYTTGTLESVSYPIAKDGLEPGDIINNPAPGPSGHVVLFAGWTDDSRTNYYAYEESPSGGAHLSEIPYPYWSGYGTFTPRRYNGMQSVAAPPITIPAPLPSIPSGPQRLVDGEFVRHDGQVYRIVGGAAVAVTSWKSVGGQRQAQKLTDTEFAALPALPEDGTYVRTLRPPFGRAETYVIAGGAPVYMPDETRSARRDAIVVDQAAIDDADAPGGLNDQPADGTVVKTEQDEYYVFAGGAPIHMTKAYAKALRPRPDATEVSAAALDQAGGLNAWSHVRHLPADFTLVKAGADVYRIEGGVPIPQEGVRGVPIDPEALANAGGAGPWSHLVSAG
jgi:hypothetical protein